MPFRNILQDLPSYYLNWNTDQVQPKNDEFSSILEQVPGMTTANVLQVLNWAVAGLAEDEIYCEIGTYLGSTLIGALWGHSQVTAWAVDNFAEYNPGGNNFLQLLAHLDQFDLTDQVCFFDQDFEAFFADFRELPEPPKIGVYFYDGAHDYRSTLMGLLLVTPFLSDEALIILDDYNWQSVQQASWDFITLYPQCKSILELHTPIARYPSFWNGLHVIQWQRNRSRSLDFNIIQQHRQQSLITDLYNLQLKEQQAEQTKGLFYEALHWHEEQNFNRAENAYQRYLDQCPEDGTAWLNLGNLYCSEEQLKLAFSCLEKALEFGSEHPSLFLNLGKCLVMSGDLNTAITYYQEGLRRYPDYLEFQDNLKLIEKIQESPADFYRQQGDRYFQAGYYAAAYQGYRLALQQGDTSETLYCNVLRCLLQPGVEGDQITLLREAVSQYPQNEFLAFHLVTALIRSADPSALAVAANLSQQQPQSFTLKLFAKLTTPLLYRSEAEIESHNQRYRTNIQNLISTLDLNDPDTLDAAVLGVNRFNNFYLTYQGYNLVWEQQQYGNLVHKIMTTRYPQWRDSLPIPPVEQKIRVGYASSYLHSYSGTFWLMGWLQYCDRTQFEIYCYYTGNTPDVVTDFFREHSDVFHHFPDQFEAVCQQIREDNLHLLVYPEIGMQGSTIAQAALRLAPIQCTAWGHPLTSGLPTIDYYLSSELMEPEDAQEHYTETVIRFPHLGICYRQPSLPDPLPKSRSDFGLANSEVVYLCCQAPFKYLPQYDDLLVSIAEKVTNAKFIFIRSEILKPRLSQAFATRGLDFDRYSLFLPSQPRPDYLALNCLADIYLDTIGFTGGNMTLDALACGLPVVTLPTSVMRGRMSAAMLRRIEVTETIATSTDHYIEIAVKLGLETPLREALKQKITARCSLLFNDRECITVLEQFYQEKAHQTIL